MSVMRGTIRKALTGSTVFQESTVWDHILLDGEDANDYYITAKKMDELRVEIKRLNGDIKSLQFEVGLRESNVRQLQKQVSLLGDESALNDELVKTQNAYNDLANKYNDLIAAARKFKSDADGEMGALNKKNEALYRMSRERANVDRGLPRKQHSGYVFLQEYKSCVNRTWYWVDTFQMPYAISIPPEEVKEYFNHDIDDFFDVLNVEKYYDYSFVRNPKSGYWEIKILFPKAITVSDQILPLNHPTAKARGIPFAEGLKDNG